MLPAYLGLYLGGGDKPGLRLAPARQLARALSGGGTVSAGFVLLFGLAGVVIGGGARALAGSYIVFYWLTIGGLLEKFVW